MLFDSRSGLCCNRLELASLIIHLKGVYRTLPWAVLMVLNGRHQCFQIFCLHCQPQTRPSGDFLLSRAPVCIRTVHVKQISTGKGQRDHWHQHVQT